MMHLLSDGLMALLVFLAAGVAYGIFTARKGRAPTRGGPTITDFIAGSPLVANHPPVLPTLRRAA